jgi:hypothetical protein
LQQLIKPTMQNQKPQYEKSGIYKITCKTCHKSYVGQTNRNLKLRFHEHLHYIKNNDPRSAYALHILNCRHVYRNINDTMTLLKQINNPSLLLHISRCIYSHFITTMNSFLNSIWMNTTLCSNTSKLKPICHKPTRQLIINLAFPVQSSLNLCTVLHGHHVHL